MNRPATGGIAPLTSSGIRARLAAAAIELPSPPRPAGAYDAGLVRSGVGVLSGQFPLVDGMLTHTGRVGAELTVEHGTQAARQAALNVLAQLVDALHERWALVGLLRVDGYVASAEDFTLQARVLDGASRLLRDILGEAGRHTRAAVAVPRLPLDAPVELVVTFLAEATATGTRAGRHGTRKEGRR